MGTQDFYRWQEWIDGFVGEPEAELPRKAVDMVDQRGQLSVNAACAVRGTEQVD